ncbi:MAG: glucuronate isomerase, partial [Pseudomonadota bacterium]
GHCDPQWWADDGPFPDPATLLIVPDHYVFRMLYSHGISLESLGVGVPEEERDPRKIFRIFADHWHTFLGTPSREWLEYTLYKILGVDRELGPETSDTVFDQIAEKLAQPDFRPRSLFDSFNIEVLATTDTATDTLDHHDTIHGSGWAGRIVPTFRPDSVLSPAREEFPASVAELGDLTGQDTSTFSGHLEALKQRRAFFRERGATATDHDVRVLTTSWLSRPEMEALHARALQGELTGDEANHYYGHMLVEMAQMSAEDGMVMQLHVGSYRNTNHALYEKFGPDKGTDIPATANWVKGLEVLLNRVGNDPRFRMIAFTLDEASYSRELAPMAGHWPCMRIGPPWWFHDSVNGLRRYFDQVVETAGYYNLAGFNDDTRAFLSIPARHNTFRRAVALHLADQVSNGRLVQRDAERLAPQLCRDLALDAYRLNGAET